MLENTFLIALFIWKLGGFLNFCHIIFDHFLNKKIFLLIDEEKSFFLYVENHFLNP